VINKDSKKKILIIKLRGIGDVVLSTVILDNLKADFPNSSIDYLTDFPSKSALEGLPQINKVLIFPRDNTWERIKLIRIIRKENYDLVFDFFSNPSTALITFFSKAKYRIGFPYRGRKYAYNLFGPEERSKYHAAELHLITLEMSLLTHDSQNLYFYISESDKLFADNFLLKNDLKNSFVVGISPSGGWQSKKCEPEKFAEIGNEIIKRYGAKIIILWGKSDKDDAEKIHQLIPGSIYAPPTSINEMASLINRCKFLIANDSGPMHISTAVGTPVLSIHGPTDPKLQGPYGDKHEWINNAELDCIVCNLLECPKNHECFKDLPLEKIIEKIESLIHKNNLLIKA
jgi:lipopolysaccharide heptosyltransferase II